jgi:ABC-type nitrate/sulfonate/bicarbonate transport system substrate-binding protein
MKSKRIALIVATLPFVTLYCALIGLAIEAHAADKVRLGFSALSLANSPAWIAEEKGIFRKYDIEPE